MLCATLLLGDPIGAPGALAAGRLVDADEEAVAVVEQPSAVRSSSLDPVEVDERAARRTLREQIAKLERELAAAFVAAFPRTGIDVRRRARRGGPRMLSLGELERLRDDLAERLADGAPAARRARPRPRRPTALLLERMLLEPGRYKWVRAIASDDIGEPGCGDWHVRPRLGLVGMLMGWWHVKISSGCPLATARA